MREMLIGNKIASRNDKRDFMKGSYIRWKIKFCYKGGAANEKTRQYFYSK